MVKSGDWAAFSSNLSLYISQKVCQKLSGDLSMDTSEDGKPCFNFHIQCLDSKMLLTGPNALRRDFEGSEQIDIDFSEVPTNDLDSLVGERSQNKILLVTANLLDKLAVEITLKDLNLIDRFVSVTSLEDAVSEIASSWQVQSSGYAMVIIDLSHE